jgi:hypothetical protein
MANEGINMGKGNGEFCKCIENEEKWQEGK